MKLAIAAATGGIGRHLLAQAVAAGHDVTVLVRDPGRVDRTHGRVRAVAADLAHPDAAAVESAVAGADAVLSALGPRRVAEAGVVTAGTAAIVAAMRTTGVRRIVVVSAAPVGSVPSPARPHPPRHDPGDGPLARLASRPLKWALRRVYADLAEMEDLLRASGLEWTVVRPPRLTDRPLTGAYRTAVDRNVRGGMTVSRADVAHLMLRVRDDPDTVGHTLGVAS